MDKTSLRKLVFVVGQPLPGVLPVGIERLVHLEGPMFSCYFCTASVFEASSAALTELVSNPADDMRHLDGWVFFNFATHGLEPGALNESKLQVLLQRASIMLDHARGIDFLAPPRVVLSAIQEDRLNPMYEFNLGGLQVTDAALERNLQLLYGAEWERHWVLTDVGSGAQRYQHIVTGFCVTQDAQGKPHYDETALLIAITHEQRPRLQAQACMLLALRKARQVLPSRPPAPAPRPPAYTAPRPPSL